MALSVDQLQKLANSSGVSPALSNVLMVDAARQQNNQLTKQFGLAGVVDKPEYQPSPFDSPQQAQFSGLLAKLLGYGA